MHRDVRSSVHSCVARSMPLAGAALYAACALCQLRACRCTHALSAFFCCLSVPACCLQDGQLKVEREKVVIETPELDPSLIFEQDPVQILDALLPLYMNSCLLRSLQEALASELAARMTAMNSATDNAKELKKGLLVKFNKQRQAKITQEISEIVSGANATS